MSQSEVYRYPRYYAIGYRWNTETECDFIEACLAAYGPAPLTARSARSPVVGAAGLPAAPKDAVEPRAAQAGGKRPLDSVPSSSHETLARGRPERAKRAEGRLLDIGCGAGRHLLELAGRGYQVTGVDVRPEMVAYVEAEANKAKLPIAVSVDDLRRLTIQGVFDAAFCFMDTFRFLLTNEEILSHLRTVARLLVSGGLYLVDFWVPRQWDQIGNEIHQWEQTEGDTTVRVFYLQHPESVDPITQTFEDELVFEVSEAGQTREIRGGPTRTRLILPQEFGLLVGLCGAFDLIGTFGDFDLTKPLEASSMTWRMVSVLRKR